MSLHYKFEHEFDLEPKAFWEMFFSEEYNTGLYAALRITGRTVLETTDDGKIMRRAVRLTPQANVPAVIAKVIPDQTYVERNVLWRDKGTMEVRIEPQVMASKFDMKGMFSVVPAGEGRCKRTFEGDVKVSILILGGQIEKFMVDQMKTSYETAAQFTRDYIKKHKAAKV